LPEVYTEMTPVSAVHAILVTYRRPTTMQRTLEALVSQSRPPDSVLVVDNDDDGELREALLRLNGTEYLSCSENVGPAGAVAVAMERLVERCGPDDWVLLVDDDDPPPLVDALEILSATATSAPHDVGAIGLTGSRFDRGSARLNRVLDENLEDLTDVDYIGSGQLPMYRVAAIRDVGVFRPELFFGFEELEYGLRLRAANWRVVIHGGLTREVRALHGRTGLGIDARSAHEPSPPWRRYYSTRNLVLISRLHGTRVAPVVMSARAIAGGSLAVLRARRLSAGTASWKGLLDGWIGRFGRTVEPGADVVWRGR
jgi:glycosyltransferase involved in cell wall biosynthesis